MGISVWPQSGSTAAAPVIASTGSQNKEVGPVLWTATGHVCEVPIYTFVRQLSGAMLSVSGNYTGVCIIFEGTTYDNPNLWRPWQAYNMQQGVWQGVAWPTHNSSSSWWMPANGALQVRMRLTAIASGLLAAAGMGMHGPADLGSGPPSKVDWSGMVIDQIPGNNVAAMMPMATVSTSALQTPRVTTLGTSYTIPSGRRLRIHSYAGSYLAGAGGGKCLVGLRSNLLGATIATSELLATWEFGPSAGGVNPNERWSGYASALTEPIDIYHSGSAASVGIVATGSAGATGLLTFNLLGHMVG